MNLMTLQYDIAGLLRRKELEKKNTLKKHVDCKKTLILVVFSKFTSFFKTRLTPTTTTTTNTHFRVKI